jgi:ketosteroid isomerase-like protein
VRAAKNIAQHHAIAANVVRIETRTLHLRGSTVSRRRVYISRAMLLRATLFILLAFAVSCASSPPPCPAVAAAPVVDRRAEIEAFNRATIDLTMSMDTTGILATWEDDGVSLLPQTAPLVGKRAIAAFLHDVDAQVAGAHMTSFELHCSGIRVNGDDATEYCEEHQVVEMPDGKPTFDGRGKLLYVLHRGADGKWRIAREMWNQGAEK